MFPFVVDLTRSDSDILTAGAREVMPVIKHKSAENKCSSNISYDDHGSSRRGSRGTLLPPTALAPPPPTTVGGDALGATSETNH